MMGNQPNSLTQKTVQPTSNGNYPQQGTQQLEQDHFKDIINQAKRENAQSTHLQSGHQQKKSKIIEAIHSSQMARSIYHMQEQPDVKIQDLITKYKNQEEVEQTQYKKQKNISKLTDLAPIIQNSQMQKEEEQLREVLYKQSPSIFGTWSQRFCILSKHRFIYKQDQSPNSLNAGIINFDLLSLTLKLITDEQKKLLMFKIIINDGNKQFVFKGKNEKITKKWTDRINFLISNSVGKIQKLTYLGHYNRFWRKDYISEHEFRRTAQTGDILLFRGKKTSAVLQRKLTMEEYDHIGVLLLNARGQIIVFEANGGLGVGLCPWKKFIKNKWYKDQDIVTYRRLIIDRPPQFLAEVTNFVEGNIGKTYKFSLKQYFFTNRYSTAAQQKKSFFCSSLVAKLYKTLELLDQNISSSQYMPSSFAEKANLMIEKGKYGEAKLQHEQILVFEQSLLEKANDQTDDF